MRQISLIACLVALSLAPAWANAVTSAEQFFKRMENTVQSAQNLQFTFDITVKGGIETTFKGDFAVASGNKLRIHTIGPSMANEKPHSVLVVSDGKRTKLAGGDPKTSEHATEATLSSDVFTLVARPGIFLPQMPLPDQKVQAKDLWRATDFKLGAREKDNERELQLVDYVLYLRGQDAPFSVTVWIDLKTHLPAKRVIATTDGDAGKITITETYRDMLLNGKLDSATFELPK